MASPSGITVINCSRRINSSTKFFHPPSTSQYSLLAGNPSQYDSPAFLQSCQNCSLLGLSIHLSPPQDRLLDILAIIGSFNAGILVDHHSFYRQQTYLHCPNVLGPFPLPCSALEHLQSHMQYNHAAIHCATFDRGQRESCSNTI